MREERWKSIFGGNYEVSSLGHVRRLTGRTAGRLLKPSNRGGYLRVSICIRKLGIGGFYSVHCLVAGAFLGSPPPGKKVNHKDLDKTNNVVSNLEYKTQLGNIRHAIRNGHGGNGGKLSSQQRSRIRGLFRTGRYSRMGLGRKFGVSPAAIRYVVGEIDYRGRTL